MSEAQDDLSMWQAGGSSAVSRESWKGQLASSKRALLYRTGKGVLEECEFFGFMRKVKEKEALRCALLGTSRGALGIRDAGAGCP